MPLPVHSPHDDALLAVEARWLADIARRAAAALPSRTRLACEASAHTTEHPPFEPPGAPLPAPAAHA